MPLGPRWVAAAAAAVVLALAPGAQADIPLELRFDGQAIDPKEKPDFTCYNYTLGRWVSCRVQKADDPGAYVLATPEPGKYRMHISVDENPANPRRYPGDYETQILFEVTAGGPERLTVDLARLIHLTQPGDNARSLEGMLVSCATQPRFDTPRFSWGPVAKVDFAWDPIVAGAEYRYTLLISSCARVGAQREIRSEKTGTTAATLTLPPSTDNEYYMFRIEAWKDGRLVGDLYTHDGGTHSWNYRFRVRNASLPRWAYLAAGAGLALLLLGVGRQFVGVSLAERRRRGRALARVAILTLMIGAVAGGGYHYYRDQQQRRAGAENAKVEAERQARQREFIAAFVSAAPRPEWWESVETPYRVDNLGDLLSAWQGFPRGDDGRGERQFFKAAYQGILDHSDDPQVVATGIDLLHWVTREYPHRLELARFGYDRYFHHRGRTDNCANCMVGDTAQGLVQNLSQLYTASGRFDEAIAVCRRLIDERGAEVSPYKLAETWNQMAWAYWHKGEHSRAMAIVRDAIARYGATVRGEDLKRTRARFEAELERAATKPSPGDSGGK
jgi:tetratricopeptide (TPR) repeat protein